MKLLKAAAGFPDTRDVEANKLARCAVVAVAAVLCAAPSALAAAAGPATPVDRIDVTMRDFKLELSRRAVPAGKVFIRVHNHGPSTHEINLDRTDLPSGSLPLQGDGLTVDEGSRALHRIASIEQLDLGASGELTVRLKPGHYVLYCNLEGHYLGGMRASFDVASAPR